MLSSEAGDNTATPPGYFHRHAMPVMLESPRSQHDEHSIFH